ncbi:MAG: ABC transporter permease [Candidatus Aminicenantes bacterium]|nr:ABC transporter permease [Candidatus Aminicenantes bacterium]
MFKNYLKIAFRNITRAKLFTFINISGLALGMACCILILIWVWDEINYDKFHTNINRLYRVTRSESAPDGSINHFASTPSPLGPTLKESYPEIVDSTRFYNISTLAGGRVLLEANLTKYYETGYCFVDPSFFSVFTFPFVHGHPLSALKDPNSVVLTEDIAFKYFGDENPIGKTVTMMGRYEYTITGVIKNVPENSHLQFDFLSPLQPLIDRYSWMSRWNIPHFFTYVIIDEDANVQKVSEKIRYHIKQYDPEFFENSNNIYTLQPVKDIHLYSKLQSELAGISTGQSEYLIFFSAIAVFVLIIACINFINLTTARSANRAKEIGMRKVSGADRRAIAGQFFGESLVMALISLFIALLLVLISLPLFSRISGKQFEPAVLLNFDILLGIGGIALITGLISGIYPALLLSSIQPASVLKGSKLEIMKNNGFRKAMVIVQFSISLILIIGTIFIYSQMTFIQKKNLGYNSNNLIYFPKQGQLTGQYEAFKAALLENSQVLGVTTSSDLPTETLHYTMVSGWEGSSSKDEMLMNYFSVDEDYLKTFDIQMVEGRFFSKLHPTDASEGFVLNEEAVKRMGMENSIGKRFSFYGREGRIVGLMKDFHFESLHQEIEPLILWIDPPSDRHIFVRIQSGRLAENIRFVESLHRKFNPEYPFDFNFLDGDIDSLYRTEMRTKQILQIFAGFAIFISCIGLYGLAEVLTMQRIKEVGIRKILGASVYDVSRVLSKDFIKAIMIASAIGMPLAYLIMSLWLRGFAYRFEVSIWIFLIPGLLMCCIALITVSYHTLKASLANPIKSLRYE